MAYVDVCRCRSVVGSSVAVYKQSKQDQRGEKSSIAMLVVLLMLPCRSSCSPDCGQKRGGDNLGITLFGNSGEKRNQARHSAMSAQVSSIYPLSRPSRCMQSSQDTLLHSLQLRWLLTDIRRRQGIKPCITQLRPPIEAVA
jgi:hypothetical protein